MVRKQQLEKINNGNIMLQSEKETRDRWIEKFEIE